MPSVDFVVTSKVARTSRVMQLEGMFDVPAREKLSLQWKGDVPLHEREWNVGLIVGPSGAGKSTLARGLFGERAPIEWHATSMIDDFDRALDIQTISETCMAVGFNTIPAWMKPYEVLSTGEKFRADLARHLLTDADPIVVDEFTSVVDRQVAHIGSNAVQKIIRKRKRKFVAVTCHYDVIEWLQPDWILEPATMTFRWRSVQRRPNIDVEISRVDHKTWELFAPFHYLTRDLHKAAACFVLFVNGEPASFSGVLYRPHAIAQTVYGLSRTVTLPDYQGLGLFFVLNETLAGAYKAQRKRFHIYPAHPPFVRSIDRSPNWRMEKRPGVFSPKAGASSSMKSPKGFGGRPCAVFEYVGPARPEAVHLLD